MRSRRGRQTIAHHQLRVGNTTETDQPPVSPSCHFRTGEGSSCGSATLSGRPAPAIWLRETLSKPCRLNSLRAVDDVFLDCRAMTSRVGHEDSLISLRTEVCLNGISCTGK